MIVKIVIVLMIEGARMLKSTLLIIIVLLLLLMGPIWVLWKGNLTLGKSYKDADRTSAHMVDSSAYQDESVVLLFKARAFNWRGMFSVHMWLSVKKKNAHQFTTYQVIGWNKNRGKPYIDVSYGSPDKKWFDQRPILVKELTGVSADKAISQIESAVNHYPYKETYRAWPGPNSNTFIDYIVRDVPALYEAMPPEALGKDYINQYTLTQFSLFGLIGWKISAKGVVWSLLGLSFGIRWSPFELIIPGVGQT